MPADPLWGEPTRTAAATHGVREVAYAAAATDPNWAANGGPAGPLPLRCIDLTWDWDADRVPMGRVSVTVAEDGNARWLSPLLRSCAVSIQVTHQGTPKTVGTFLLRRRRRSYPGGDIILDLATRDAEWPNQWVAVELGGA